MNREIKFRIWLPHLKLFGNPLEVVIGLDGKVYGFTRPTINDSRFLVEISQFRELRDCVIQRFTGLFDDNGKEIYEGDIIKDTWKENHPYGYLPDKEYDMDKIFEVKYSGCSFNLEFERSEAQICVENFHREIIGNIFETSELLKK